MVEWHSELVSRAPVKDMIASGSGRIRAEVVFTATAREKANALHRMLARAKDGVLALVRDDLKPRTTVVDLEV